MVEVKISIIGAGSATFSVGLVRDLCLTPSLEGSTVNFMDINRERLEAVYALCRRYADEVGINLRLEKTTNRKESLRDADFVINTAMVVGYGGYRAGWQIGFKHRYRFGGSYHIMHDEGFWINYHQFKLFESIAEDILDICPEAWYIKVANPVLAGVTMMGRKYPKLRFVGLCHGYCGIFDVIHALGLDARHVTYLAPGVNHFIWLTHFHYRSENAYPLLDDWIQNKAEKYWENIPPSSGLGPKAVDLYRRFGIFPIGDTCTPGGGSWPWWYHINDETEKKWRENPRKWWNFVLEPPEKDPVAELMKLAQDPTVKVTDVFPPRKSGESIIDIVESIACDVPRVFQVNIMNSGNLIPGVPCNFEVEVPALISKRGLQGIKTDGLPKPLIAYILRDRVAPVETELEAGSRELLLQLIMMDPWTRSKEQAEKLLEEILNLPFNKEMNEHYK